MACNADFEGLRGFVTCAMTYASEDIEILRKYFSDDDFKAALDNPAPGIFD